MRKIIGESGIALLFKSREKPTRFSKFSGKIIETLD
jgi:hypothetical protein